MEKLLFVKRKTFEQTLFHDISSCLLREGYGLDCTSSLGEALIFLEYVEYKLILLDSCSLDISEGEACGEIRKKSMSPLIVVSSFRNRKSMILAFHNGADDYMVKPVDQEELISRIHANIRRNSILYENIFIQNRIHTSEIHRSEVYHLKKYVFMPEKRCVYDREDIHGNKGKIGLSPIECALLELFAKHPDTLFLYQDIYRYVWKNESLGDVRGVMVHVSNLRKKIDLDKTGMIQSVRGVGYIFHDG